VSAGTPVYQYTEEKKRETMKEHMIIDSDASKTLDLVEPVPANGVGRGAGVAPEG
jgi:hypothetical protein